MWTKWGLNPRPHATELLPELAKQARYHCAIRPSDKKFLAENTNVRSRCDLACAAPIGRYAQTPVNYGQYQSTWLLMLMLCNPTVY